MHGKRHHDERRAQRAGEVGHDPDDERAERRADGDEEAEERVADAASRGGEHVGDRRCLARDADDDKTPRTIRSGSWSASTSTASDTASSTPPTRSVIAARSMRPLGRSRCQRSPSTPPTQNPTIVAIERERRP